MIVLVTGGAGYIGSHVALALLDRGDEVVVLDDLSTGRRELLDPRATFIEGSIGDEQLLQQLFSETPVDAVMHFAAKSIVPESLVQPLEYWRTNTVFAHNLLKAAVDAGVSSFLYSSTAAVYGEPQENPVSESAKPMPINPYGASKYAFEQMLFDVAAAGLIAPAALRYFNVAGADPALRSGQATPSATHLIKVAVQTALGQRPSLEIYGTDWTTPDGTCIRDYIHVSDLANIHLLVLDALRSGFGEGIFNCGYGRGHSVREVVDTVQRICGPFDVHEAPRRAGDPESLVADSKRLSARFGWQPSHDDLDEIVRTAYEFEKKLSQGLS